MFVTSTGRGARAGLRHPRQMPACRARRATGWRKQMGRLTVDSPMPYLLSDLAAILQNEMGKLDKGTQHAALSAAASTQARRDQGRSALSASCSPACWWPISMAGFLAKIFRLPARRQADLDHRRVGRAVRDHLVVVVGAGAAGLRLRDLGARRGAAARSCWSAKKRIATFPTSTNGRRVSRCARSWSASPRRAANMASRLGLITQRPSDLAEGVLSQCGTIISMRLNNDRDQAFVKAAMPEGSRGFLDAIPALRNRECIICGEGVVDPDPRRLRQSGGAPAAGLGRSVFTDLWRASGGEEEDTRADDQPLAQSGALRAAARAALSHVACRRPSGEPVRIWSAPPALSGTGRDRRYARDRRCV